MTRKELIDKLMMYGEDDTEVRFSYYSGDYWHTLLAQPIDAVKMRVCTKYASNGYETMQVLDGKDIDRMLDRGERLPDEIIIID